MRLKSQTIIEQFEKNVLDNGQRIAMTCKEKKFAWERVRELTDKLVLTLLHLGVNKGEKVAIWSGNSPGWFIAYLAIAKIGAVSVLVNHKYKKHELLHVLKHSEARFICYGDNQSELVIEETIQELRGSSIGIKKAFIPIGENAFCKWETSSPITGEEYRRIEKISKQVQPKDVASMIFTSGTTSKPKGIMLTHFQLINIAHEMVAAMHWTRDDHVCVSLPLFHSFGLSTEMLATLVHGGTIHFTKSYHSEDVMACIEENRCNVLNGVPSIFLAILYNHRRKEYDLSSLDSGIIAGSGIHERDFLKIAKELKMNHLMQSFGQSEASPSITFSGYEDPLELRAKSVGRKIHHIDLRIVNLKTKEVNGPFKEGEIQISGYNVMKGYYKDEIETKKVLGEDGWLHTGDIGYLDREDNLYISGRLKDIIIRCGENISPKEIEEVILENAEISQVKVFGIPMPVVQEEIVACIESSSMIDEDSLRKRLKLQLADYKIPKYIMVYQKFPKLSNGKIDINELKQGALKKMKEEVKR